MKTKRVLLMLIMLGFTGVQTDVLAQNELTGMFRLSHTTTEVVGPQMAQGLSEIIPVDEELQWQVFVPENYDRQRAPGVFVFLDANGWGGIPDQWQQVFRNHNLIWIGPRSNESRASENKKAWQAILAGRLLEQEYAVDLNRLYIGSSGSNALPAIIAMLMANEFQGGVYMKGSMHWDNIEADHLESLRRKRHVFITGTDDEAKQKIRRDFEAYKKDGIENVKLIFDMERIGNMPKPEQMDDAIRYLDAR